MIKANTSIKKIVILHLDLMHDSILYVQEWRRDTLDSMHYSPTVVQY